MDKSKSFGLNIYNILKRLGLRDDYVMYGAFHLAHTGQVAVLDITIESGSLGYIER